MKIIGTSDLQFMLSSSQIKNFPYGEEIVLIRKHKPEVIGIFKLEKTDKQITKEKKIEYKYKLEEKKDG